ncbi:MAG: DNA-protecting protein DprA [Rhizobacter sp.]|nr:DNA-protecting protein DprA [Chlorobiales bacterium]
MTVDTDFKIQLLTLSRVVGIGAARLRVLVQHFGTAERVLAASAAELGNVEGIGESLARSIVGFSRGAEKVKASEAATKQLELAEKFQASLITLWDENYPAMLREIYDPPAYFFMRGSLTAEDEQGLAIVGTRYPTEYGKNAAKRLVEELAPHGFTIVSGLAYGIDSVAHTAAIQNRTRTIAVLGSGTDIIYTDPKGILYPKIIEQGAIISEEWMGAAPVAENFPKRNRIISALSQGTVIIESDLKGGAMITAKYAMEQNREVFAVPGSIFSKKSRGTNALIRDSGAKLVMSAEDILNELRPKLRFPSGSTATKVERALPEMTDDESKLYSFLQDEPVHIDELALQSGLDISDVLVLLFELEMKECITQLPGKFFQKR